MHVWSVIRNMYIYIVMTYKYIILQNNIYIIYLKLLYLRNKYISGHNFSPQQWWPLALCEGLWRVTAPMVRMRMRTTDLRLLFWNSSQKVVYVTALHCAWGSDWQFLELVELWRRVFFSDYFIVSKRVSLNRFFAEGSELARQLSDCIELLSARSGEVHTYRSASRNPWSLSIDRHWSAENLLIVNDGGPEERGTQRLAPAGLHRAAGPDSGESNSCRHLHHLHRHHHSLYAP